MKTNRVKGSRRLRIFAIVFAVVCVGTIGTILAQLSVAASEFPSASRVTNLGTTDFARSPQWIASAVGVTGPILLWRQAWSYEPAQAKAGVPIGWAIIEGDAASLREPIRGVFGLCASWSLVGSPDGKRLTACFERNSFYRSSKDIVLWDLNVRTDGTSVSITADEGAHSAVPHHFEETVEPAAIEELQRKVFDYRITSPYSEARYIRPSLLRSEAWWYLAGVSAADGKGTIWFSALQDGDPYWRAPLSLVEGNYPYLVDLRDDRVGIIYTDSGPFAYQAEWPDDAYPRPPKPAMWPATGSLSWRTTRDYGRTWTEPVIITQGDAIQAVGAESHDGTLWVVFVGNGERYGCTSLWLTSSTDGGNTWGAPKQITDGHYLDREPDIAWGDNGKLLVAFSRTKPGGSANIWVVELDRR